MNPVELDETTILPPPSDESNELGPGLGLHADSLADSVVILLSLTVIQRLVGFGRSVLFCRWLPPEELGLWDISFSFLMLAAPLSMLALPACFGRYVEFYRQQGQLRTLLRRTAAAVLCLTAASCVAVYLARGWFSVLIYGQPGHESLVTVIALSLAIIVSTHYFLELLTGLRNVRFLAIVQFVNSLAFALLGAALIFGIGQTAGSVVLSYAGACLFSTAMIVWRLWPTWRTLPTPETPTPRGPFWAKILPYVGWVSLTNLTASLFEIVDRYMIIHFSPEGPAHGLEQVGQYHSSRVVPLLLVSIATMLGSMMTPHLSADWEAGRRREVGSRFNLILKLLSFFLTIGAVAVMIAAPLLFDRAFAGKFSAGRDVLPLTLTYCIWFGMTLVSQNYLWCAEKARLASVALALGLACNVGLNLLLLPRYGLAGAVTATAAANLVSLALMILFCRLLGFRPDLGTCLVLAVPGLLILGVWATLAALVVLTILAGYTPWLLHPAEKGQIAEALATYRERTARLVRRRDS